MSRTEYSEVLSLDLVEVILIFYIFFFLYLYKYFNIVKAARVQCHDGKLIYF